jgi:hypothetical protein
LLSGVAAAAAMLPVLRTPMQAADATGGATARRVLPADPSWPSAASWEKLNQEVGGRLVKVQSPLAACEAASDTPSCQNVLKNLQNPYYVGDQAGATQSTGWLDAWTLRTERICSRRQQHR